MKKFLLSLLVVMMCVSFLYAKDDKGKKENWFVFDVDNMTEESKAEIKTLYNNAKLHMLDGKKQVVRMGDDLANVIEAKGTEFEQNKRVKAIANEVVRLTDDGRKAFKAIGAKMNELSGWLVREEINYDVDRYQNRLFAADGVDEIYELLEDAGVKEYSKKQLQENYGQQIAKINNELNSTYYQYLGFWLAGIDYGKDYTAARAAYTQAIENEIALVVRIYNDEINKLNKDALAKVTAERKKNTEQQVDKIEKNKKQINKL